MTVKELSYISMVIGGGQNQVKSILWGMNDDDKQGRYLSRENFSIRVIVKITHRVKGQVTT